MTSLQHFLQVSSLLAVVAVGVGCAEPSSSEFEPDRKYDGPCIVEVDHAYNGDVIDEREVYTYNDLGQLVVWEHDNGPAANGVADGVLEQRITYTYYDDGKLATKENDHAYGGTNAPPVDGIIESRLVYFYDGEGKLERREHDKGEGTDLFRLLYYSYNDSDLLALIEDDLDPGDSAIDQWEIFDYDAAGNLLTRDSAEGTIDAVNFRTQYTYDADDNVEVEEVDDQADGTVDYRITYAYDTDGNMVEQVIDGQGVMGYTPPDGVVDIRYLFTYDAAGNLSTMTMDGYPHDANGADGLPEMVTTYFYDEFGNLLTEERDEELGEGDTVTTYTYDCWADIP